MLKIDVGGEYEVLHGEQIIAKQRPVLIAEVHHQQAAEQIISWLSNTNTVCSGIDQKKNPPGICLLGLRRQMDRTGCGTAGEGQRERGGTADFGER